MKACVLSFAARSGTGTQTVTGVVDQNGGAFTGHTLIPICIYGADGVLTSTGNGYGWNIGVDTGSLAGAAGDADISQFGVKICSNGQSTNRSILDTGANGFFGGDIFRLAKVTAWNSGSFDLQYDTNARTGDTIVCIVLGGADLNVDVVNGTSNGVYATTAAPVGVLCLPLAGGINSSAGAANGTNGSGGGPMGLGWDTKIGGRGAATQHVVNQAGNIRQQVTDAFFTTPSSPGGSPAVTTWGASSYTITGSSGSPASALQLAFSGTGIAAKAGTITQPPTTGFQTISTGIAPRLILLLSFGAPASSSPQTDSAEMSLGMADHTRQCDMWTGENGISPTVNGARIVSTSKILRFGTPAGSGTTFHSTAEFVGMNDLGGVTINWTATDGTARQILWFALGETAATDTTKPIYKVDADSVALDENEGYTGYVQTRVFLPDGGLGSLHHHRECYITGRTSGAGIVIDTERDFGKEFSQGRVVLSGSGSHVTKKFEGVQFADAQAVSLYLGEDDNAVQLWSIDHFHIIVPPPDGDS